MGGFFVCFFQNKNSLPRHSAVPLKRCRFSHKYSQKTPHSSPVRASYGVSFMDPASDWYSAAPPVIIYVISSNIGPGYNDTLLYMDSHFKDETFVAPG